MSTDLQEILALAIVATAVVLMLWRRLRRRGRRSSACQGCDAGKTTPSQEKTVRCYRRQP